MIGRRLTELLLQSQYHVSHLGRARREDGVPSFVWSVEGQTMDEHALEGVGTIIHLAGANVADERWTVARKKEILESRTRSASLLYEYLRKSTHTVRCVISASAIGYYGVDRDDNVLIEESKAGKDFLAQVVDQWEQAVDRIATLGIRVVKIRTGIVLSDRGGALQEIARPIRWGVGASLGSGDQWVSWVHLDDLCRVFIKAVEDESTSGPYNAVAPNPVNNRNLTTAIARILKRPLWLPAVPAFVLRAILGEMADVVLHGAKVSCSKIEKTGFTFQFLNLDSALIDLLKK